MMALLEWKIPVWQAAIATTGLLAAQWYMFSHRAPRLIAETKNNKQEGNAGTRSEDPTEGQVQEHDDDDDSYEDPYDPAYLFYDGPYEISDDYTVLAAPYKMLLIVNMELKMGKGKIAAQCGHATMGAIKLARKYCKTAMRNWEMTGVAKIAVKAETEAEMYELYEKAKENKLVAYIVQDAGRTQIAAGSRTVLVLGPAPASYIDPICSHLKLL